MVVDMTIKKVTYLMVTIWWPSFPIYICGIEFFDCAVCFNSATARKWPIPSV